MKHARYEDIYHTKGLLGVKATHLISNQEDFEGQATYRISASSHPTLRMLSDAVALAAAYKISLAR